MYWAGARRNWRNSLSLCVDFWSDNGGGWHKTPRKWTNWDLSFSTHVWTLKTVVGARRYSLLNMLTKLENPVNSSCSVKGNLPKTVWSPDLHQKVIEIKIWSIKKSVPRFSILQSRYHKYSFGTILYNTKLHDHFWGFFKIFIFSCFFSWFWKSVMVKNQWKAMKINELQGIFVFVWSK